MSITYTTGWRRISRFKCLDTSMGPFILVGGEFTKCTEYNLCVLSGLNPIPTMMDMKLHTEAYLAFIQDFVLVTFSQQLQFLLVILESLGRLYHHAYLQVFLGPNGVPDVDGNELPRLVYVSREKRPGFDHHKKAGAMNALVCYTPSSEISFCLVNICVCICGCM